MLSSQPAIGISSLSPAHLHQAEFPAHPGARQGSNCESDGIPMRSQVTIPCHDRADDTHDQAEDAANQGMLHRTIGAKSGIHFLPRVPKLISKRGHMREDRIVLLMTYLRKP